MSVSTGPDLELQKAINTALTASADIKELLGTPARLYELPDPKSKFPYVVIGEGTVIPDLAEGIDGSEVFPVLHIWSKSVSEAKKISATICAVLSQTTIDGSENTFKLFERDQLGDVIQRDPDGVTIHIASHYRALSEPK